jgi:hypothetical protein
VAKDYAVRGIMARDLGLGELRQGGRRRLHLGPLTEALEDLSGFGQTFPAGKVSLLKAFADIRFPMTRLERGNDLHRAMVEAFCKSFGPQVAEHPIEMTRETWRRAPARFDRVHEDCRGSVLAARDRI